MCIHLHFPKLNNICHFSDHLTNLSRSSCKLCLSVSFVTFLNTFVSSANLSTSRSFIYIKNSIGPNTDPCGTPLQTDFQFEIFDQNPTALVAGVQQMEDCLDEKKWMA